MAGLGLAFDFAVVLVIIGHAFEDAVEGAGGLADGDHVDEKLGKDLGMSAEGIGEGHAGAHVVGDLEQHLLKGLGVLLFAQDIEGLSDGHGGLDEDGELPEERNDLGHFHLAADGEKDVWFFLLEDGETEGHEPVPFQLRAERFLVARLSLDHPVFAEGVDDFTTI